MLVHSTSILTKYRLSVTGLGGSDFSALVKHRASWNTRRVYCWHDRLSISTHSVARIYYVVCATRTQSPGTWHNLTEGFGWQPMTSHGRLHHWSHARKVAAGAMELTYGNSCDLCMQHGVFGDGRSNGDCHLCHMTENTCIHGWSSAH